MTRNSGRSHRKKGGGPSARPRTNDGAIYIGLLLIGAFAILIVYIVTEGRHARSATLGYVMAMAFFVNLYALNAWRGTKLAPWQQALARVPMRFAGYGTRHGKPLEAVHGTPEGRNALVLCLLISLAIIVGVSVILWPQFYFS